MKIFAQRLSLLVLAAVSISCTISLKSEGRKAHPIDVHLAYHEDKNELNTFEGWYKRQLEGHRFAQTKLELTPDQQILILNKAIVTQFFHLPDSLTSGAKDSTSEHFLHIQAEDLNKTVYWKGGLQNPAVSTTGLPELMNYIDSIVSSTEAVQQLPPAQTGS